MNADNHQSITRQLRNTNRDMMVAQEGSKSRQFLYALVVSLEALVCGCAIFWNPPKENFEDDFHFEDMTLNYYYVTTLTLYIRSRSRGGIDQAMKSEWHQLTACFLIGGIMGALFAGYVVDRVGRRGTLLWSSIPWICSWVMLVKLDYDLYLLYAARFLCGIVTGMFSTVIPMYLTEIAQDSVRGILGTMFQLFLTVGFLFDATISDYTILNSTCVALTGVCLISFFFIPESPVFLAKKNVSAAKEALKRLRGPRYNVDVGLQNFRHQDRIVPVSTLNAMIISTVLMVCLKFCGKDFIVSAAVKTFSSSSLKTIGIVQTVATLIACVLVDRVGRRSLLIVSGLGMAVCLTALAPLLDDKSSRADVSACLMIVFIAAYSVGFGAIPWLMPGELFPPRNRGLAFGVIVTAYWVASLLYFLFSIFLFDDIVKRLSVSVIVMLFAVISVISAAFTYLFLPETMGKSIQLMQPSSNEI